MTQINELVLRIPAMDNVEGHSVGEEVAQRVAEALPENIGNHYIPDLKIKVTGSPFQGTGAMTEAIAAEILREIKLATL